MNTRKQLIELFITLNTLLEQKDVTPKFKYASAKNLRKLENNVQTLMYIEAGIENIITSYKQEYKNLIQSYGEVNEIGKFQIDVESSKGKEVKEKIEELNTKYKEDLDKYSESEKKYMELLEGEVVFDFISELHKIAITELPSSTTRKQLDSLLDFNLILE